MATLTRKTRNKIKDGLITTLYSLLILTIVLAACSFALPATVLIVLYSVVPALIFIVSPILRKALSWFVALYMYNKYGEEALHEAAFRGYQDVVKVMLDHSGIDPNKKGKYEYTALHHAAREGRLDAVTVLLDHPDVDPNAKDDRGETPLYWAVWYICVEGELTISNIKTITALMTHPGVDPNPKNNHGKTPLMLVAEYIQRYESKGLDMGCRACAIILVLVSPIDICDLEEEIEAIGNNKSVTEEIAIFLRNCLEVKKEIAAQYLSPLVGKAIEESCGSHLPDAITELTTSFILPCSTDNGQKLLTAYEAQYHGLAIKDFGIQGCIGQKNHKDKLESDYRNEKSHQINLRCKRH